MLKSLPLLIKAPPYLNLTVLITLPYSGLLARQSPLAVSTGLYLTLLTPNTLPCPRYLLHMCCIELSFW